MKLAVFADGTWNRVEKEGVGTNVVRLHHLAVNDPARGQRTFYDPGVGTNAWQRLQGGLFGVGISQNIKDGYSFLVEHWGADDNETAHEVYLFGFSRGAYTVRSLGGLLGRIGLVRTLKDVDEAYDLYREGTPEQRAAFQSAKVLTKPRIRMIGVWDTVGALGIPLNWLNQLNPYPHRFHDTTLGRRVEAAYHAVAVDERRVAYQPTLWDPLPAGSTQTLEQVFFPGVHSDVGRLRRRPAPGRDHARVDAPAGKAPRHVAERRPAAAALHRAALLRPDPHADEVPANPAQTARHPARQHLGHGAPPLGGAGPGVQPLPLPLRDQQPRPRPQVPLDRLAGALTRPALVGMLSTARTPPCASRVARPAGGATRRVATTRGPPARRLPPGSRPAGWRGTGTPSPMPAC